MCGRCAEVHVQHPDRHHHRERDQDHGEEQVLVGNSYQDKKDWTEVTLPRRGTEREVGGMISARRRKNTVRESKMEMERDTCKRFE